MAPVRLPVKASSMPIAAFMALGLFRLGMPMLLGLGLGMVWYTTSSLSFLGDLMSLEILGDGAQTRSYIHVSDAVEATLTAWKCCPEGFGVYNVGSWDWVTVDEIADIILQVMGLDGVKRFYRPVLHGVGWPGDVKRIALNIEKLKSIGWRPRFGSREALIMAAKSILEELRGSCDKTL